MPKSVIRDHTVQPPGRVYLGLPITRARNLGTSDIEAARCQFIERLPIGRVGTPNDIAKGIVFLASDDAASMTGAGLVIDGGITAQ